jgi:hypothetical protein
MRCNAVAVSAVVLALWTLPLRAQSGPYTPKNGVLNWKAVIFGGAFRTTTAIPLHGDFSHFNRVEVVQATSLIGPDAPGTLLHRLTEELVAQFTRSGRFDDVSILKAYEPHPQATDDTAAEMEEFRTADPLDAPMRPKTDLPLMDAERASARQLDDTMVVSDEVIDYARGNKWLQLLFLNLGNGLVTLRLSYYDKATGEEIGRSVISSDNSSKVVPSLLSSRTPLVGVAEGLVDQVVRRKVAAER